MQCAQVAHLDTCACMTRTHKDLPGLMEAKHFLKAIDSSLPISNVLRETLRCMLLLQRSWKILKKSGKVT
eukprot:2352583-Amphidinium_carterae.1